MNGGTNAVNSIKDVMGDKGVTKFCHIFFNNYLDKGNVYASKEEKIELLAKCIFEYYSVPFDRNKIQTLQDANSEYSLAQMLFEMILSVYGVEYIPQNQKIIMEEFFNEKRDMLHNYGLSYWQTSA